MLSRIFSGVLGLALFLCSFSNANADTTGNILGTGCSAWDAGTSTYCVDQNWWGGTSGGSQVQIHNNYNYMYFGYTQQIAAQVIAINQALSQTGLQVDGYNYHWHIKNKNTESVQGGVDPISITVEFRDVNNNVVESYTYDYSFTQPWTHYAGTETFKNPYAASFLNEVEFSVKGQDTGYWAGYYGPEAQIYDFSLNYSPLTPGAIGAVDPCSQVPVTDPTCPGFIGNQVVADTSTTGIPETTVTETSTQPIVETTTVAETVIAADPVAEKTVEQQAVAQSTTTQQAAATEVTATQPVEPVQSQPSISTSRVLSIVQNSASGQDGNYNTQVLATGSALPSNPVASLTSGQSTTTQSSQTSDSSSDQGQSGGQNSVETALASAQQNESENKDEQQKEDDATLGEQPKMPQVQMVAYNVVIPDVAFYASVEIYKKQFVPDSKRGLRMGLANELKWNQMVDLQFTK